VILPFEEALLREHGIDATFVGHPLLDRARALPERAEARRTLGVGEGDRLLALFPGSRAQEIARHLDPFVETARALQRREPSLKVVVSAAPHVEIAPERCPFPLVRSASFAVLRAADAAMCKSGTTTLEAAVAGCPMVVAYRTSVITYAAAKRLVRIPHIGLVNVVAGREVAPEFVQDALVPARVRTCSRSCSTSKPRRIRMIEELDRVRAMLGEAGRRSVSRRWRSSSPTATTRPRAPRRERDTRPVDRASGTALIRVLAMTWRMRPENDDARARPACVGATGDLHALAR
jgi:lipid-A-disaccharide synthase